MTESVLTESRPHRRIAIVGPSYPYRGGIAHFVDSLDEELRSRGHVTSIHSFRRLYPRLLFPGQTQYEPDADESAEKANRVVDTLSPLSWISCARKIRAEQMEVVVLNHWLPVIAPAMGSIARRLSRHARTVLVVHNAIPHEPRPGDRMLTRYVVRAAHQRIALSQIVADDLRNAFGVDSTVIPHPLYDRFGPAPDRAEARQALRLSPDVPVLLFFGFVREYKGLDILLRAMPDILSTLPEAVLIVAGEFYDPLGPYRDIIATTNIGASVRLDNRYIPTEEVPAFFAACDVVVQPYRTATQSGVAQIAFNYDCPVITTDVGGLAEIVRDGETGLVVATAEPRAISRAVIRFFGEGMAERMRQNIGYERGSRSWAQLADHIENV